MKIIQYTAVVAMVMGMLIGTPAFAAGDDSDVITHHQTLAAQYEAKAAEQDALIAEHTSMTKEYDKRWGWMTVKAGKSKDVLDMDKHCVALAQAAQAQKNELLSFAKWHRMRAAELQGQ